VVGLDVRFVTGHPCVELVHLVGERLRVAHPLVLAEEMTERRHHVPGTGEEAAVGTAAAGATDVGLDEDDVDTRSTLGELVGRPQAGEAAADDADVGGRLAGQRGAWLARIGLQRLVQPPTAGADRRHVGRGTVTAGAHPGTSTRP